MKVNINNIQHLFIGKGKRKNPPKPKNWIAKKNKANQPVAKGLAELARKNHYGDLFACQIIFLGAISQEVLSAFIQKVRDENNTSQAIAMPSEKDVRTSNFNWQRRKAREQRSLKL